MPFSLYLLQFLLAETFILCTLTKLSYWSPCTGLSLSTARLHSSPILCYSSDSQLFASPACHEMKEQQLFHEGVPLSEARSALYWGQAALGTTASQNQVVPAPEGTFFPHRNSVPTFFECGKPTRKSQKCQAISHPVVLSMLGKVPGSELMFKRKQHYSNTELFFTPPFTDQHIHLKCRQLSLLFIVAK